MKVSKIDLNNVKAHKLLNIKTFNKNFLLFGDNGSGKSSIYEALKIAFFGKHELSDYKNKEKIADLISIKIEMDNGKIIENNDGISSSNIGKFDIYCIDMLYCETTTVIDLFQIINDSFFISNKKKLFSKYFTLDTILLDNSEKLIKYHTLDNHLERFLKIVEKQANKIISLHFYENITIKIDFLGSHLDVLSSEINLPRAIIKVTDVERKILNEPRIHLLLNEAKAKLVYLSLFFAFIQSSESKMPKFLILDDFITSLDMSNRSFVARYLLENFQDYQIFIFTHNIHFFNLIKYMFDAEIIENANTWSFANLYHFHDGTTINSNVYYEGENDTVESLKKEFTLTQNDPVKLKELGNKIRKKFEKLLYNYQNFYYLGRQEEIEVLLTQIISNSPIYIEQTKILKEIQTESNASKIKHIIKNKKYIPNELSLIMRNAKFFRKIVMNPSSHYDSGSMVNFKEFDKTLDVMKQLEDNIKTLIKPNNRK